MGRKTNIEARRSQIADALIGLLAQSAFEQITVVQIARAADLAPGLVHHNFESKDEVLTLAVDRLAVQLEVRLAERLRPHASPRARVDAFIDAWLAVDPASDPRAALAWVAIGEEARRRPEVRAVYVASLARATERLREEIASVLPGEPKRHTRRIAQSIVVAIEGALRVGTAGGLEPGTAAPLVRAMAGALLEAAARPS